MKHAGGTHNSTAIQDTALWETLMSETNILPAWALVVGDNAYEKRKRLLVAYSGKGLSIAEDS